MRDTCAAFAPVSRTLLFVERGAPCAPLVMFCVGSIFLSISGSVSQQILYVRYKICFQLLSQEFGHVVIEHRRS